MIKALALRFGFGMVAAAMVLTLAMPAWAQQGRRASLDFIRDAEIEHIIRTFSRPIFDAAGIDADAVTFALVKDRAVNAFVAGGMNIFLYTGLLQQVEEPSQLIGVIAHETGHIAGGHLVRGREAMENASTEAILSLLLGLGAAAVSGNAGAGMATIFGGQELARRSFLAFSRTQEASADQAGMSFLDRAGISVRGMLRFFEILSSQELLPQDSQIEYVRTHPLTRDRIDSVRSHLEHSRFADRPLPAGWDDLFQRMKAKLEGFIQPVVALRHYRESDPSIAARYGRAVALYQRGDLQAALPMIDRLIEAEPKNPFFLELKGQVLMENGRVKESLAPYRRSVELLPESGLLRAALAQALLEGNDPKVIDEALANLRAAQVQEGHTPFVWRLMATAWGRKNNPGMIAYSLAEEALARNDKGMARGQAERAEKLLPVGSPAWLRAQDIRGVVGAATN